MRFACLVMSSRAITDRYRDRMLNTLTMGCFYTCQHTIGLTWLYEFNLYIQPFARVQVRITKGVGTQK